LADDKPLAGQAAIVTGGVRRIGRATALALARAGASVVINARSSRAEAERVAQEVEAAGARALVALADVTDEHAVAGMVASTIAAFGRADILVNNAANRAESPFLQMSFAQWREITGVMLDGAFLCSRAALAHMVKNKHGRIVNIGGVSSHLGAGRRAHVGAAKAGQGITVNCVVPGRIGGERSANSGRGITADPPVGREGVPEDVGNMICTLCLPTSGYITGQTIHVNGGLFMP
jgi:3-oxoacyl-[acyl-carrier protein] reductase